MIIIHVRAFIIPGTKDRRSGKVFSTATILSGISNLTNPKKQEFKYSKTDFYVTLQTS
jgi:hypothetical protein